jgi:membrane-associated protease RseP (regulator of RpoE activity)
MLTFLIVALGVAAIVAIHEASHMLVSKLFGVKVLRFSLGFGSVLFSKQLGETSYELRVLPLGGFVQMEGDSPESNVERGFFSLPWWKRSLIALAGPIANLLLGFGLLLGVLVFAKGWPLVAGLVRAYKISSFVVIVTLKWLFGISSPLVPAPHVSDMAGPIMVTKILADSLSEGISMFLFMLSMISLNIGLFNLFPIPALDGGHIALYLGEAIRGKKFSSKTYILWNYVGFVLLILLLLFTCFLDLTKILK